ncbi:MAG: phosphate signaling complex protein PhoU [Candidatus Bathyarchaeota archaeon]|nr:phosphate signaling complex protein PhoU [Candidatus Bathyarchaeota archaeon]
MNRIIDRGLEQQSVLLIRMGELTYETLSLSIHGYLEGRSVQTQVREMSNLLVSMANKVEDETFELISRYQPVASDLRSIKSYMKIGNDFARYGRYALDISAINEKVNGLKECETWIKDYLSEMSQKVLSMVKVSIEALKKFDINLAKTIAETERQVDKMYLEYIDRLISVEQAQANSRCIVSSALITRYLERIADHAVYVCESIVYIVTGEKITLS